ncbi:envelope stress response membrane protein PspC [Vibrio aerogenes]|nr:envelope stress response membrane protein PspC [Vibrio aerogenes]
MMSRHLYRATENKRITGVCAGLANYFGWEAWLVRMIVVSATLLGAGGLTIMAYIALSLMLDKQPESYEQTVEKQRAHKLKSRPWEQGQAPGQLLAHIEQEFSALESQVCRMEAYVTSESFRVNKAFRDL